MPLSYLQWNDLLASHFFTEEKAGKEVLLYVNEPLIEELGGPFGAGLAEFVEAVKAGPPWTTRSGICQRALQALEGWRDRDLSYPPYIAYLGLYVLAGGIEGDYAPHAYYPRLQDLLGHPRDTRAPSSFGRMLDLWDDLEQWSREDHHENLGRFVARFRGQWWRIGLPLSQTLISEDERKRLPLLLRERKLDPLDLPSQEVILRLLREDGRTLLHRRTLQLLDAQDHDGKVLRDALSEVVLEELEAWDGTVEDSAGSLRRRKTTALRLCLQHDALAQHVTCHVRIRTLANFPEDGCTFVRSGDDCHWTCEDLLSGWSKKLYDPLTSRELDGATLDWTNGERLEDEENGWLATLRPATTRLFMPGEYDGLPDYVERQRLERNTRFLIATRSADIAEVSQWGESYCGNFKHHTTHGLPNGWTLFQGQDALRSCPGVDVLTISTTVRLLLRGGIKTGRGNLYLKGAPPYIVLENARGDERVTLDSEQLERDQQHSQVWRIPDDAPEGVPLRIEVHTDQQILRRVIRIESPHLPLRQGYTCFRRDSAGTPTSDALPYANGAIVQYEPGSGPPPYPQDLPLHLSARITLIGATPGEIAVWPDDELPDWVPVWALVKDSRRQLRAVFCGSPEQARLPYKETRPKPERALVRHWKTALWHARKRTSPPPLRELRKRWQEYVQAAKNVR